MSTHPYAGKSAPKELLIDVGRLEAAFYEGKPDPSDPNRLVSFGTSGHRGTIHDAIKNCVFYVIAQSFLSVLLPPRH